MKGPQLILQASSAGELLTWLKEKESLVGDNVHLIRSLSRVLFSLPTQNEKHPLYYTPLFISLREHGNLKSLFSYLEETLNKVLLLKVSP